MVQRNASFAKVYDYKKKLCTWNAKCVYVNRNPEASLDIVPLTAEFWANNLISGITAHFLFNSPTHFIILPLSPNLK